MKLVAVALGLLGLGSATAVGWSRLVAGAGPISAAEAESVEPRAAQPHIDGARIFLSRGQVTQALESGTLDRSVKSLLRVQRPLEYGNFVWNDAAVPSGPTWIRVDLQSQLISVFRAGYEIGTAVIVYGGDNKQTPIGKLHILAKSREHRSSLYDASMPYTLRLTGDGVSIHGSSVRWGAATHGCIGVPMEFARRLFDAAHVGDEVVIRPARAVRS